MKLFVFSLLLVGLLFQSAYATEYTAQYKDCAAKAASMADSRQCAADELKRQDALLGAEYKLVMSRAAPNAKAALSKAQSAWSSFRDADCKAQEAGITGSGAADMYFSCMLDYTNSRISQLENYWAL